MIWSKRNLSGRALLVFLSLALTASLSAGVAAQAAAGPLGRAAEPSTGIEDAVSGLSLGHLPYYSPDVAAMANPRAEEIEDAISRGMPDEFLPESLKEEKTDGPRGEYSAALSGGGTGGWTEIARAYSPSADPDVSYYSSGSWAARDNSGRQHLIYEVSVLTDVSQPPDGPGFMITQLTSCYYTNYLEGRWSTPEQVVPVNGFEDSTMLATYTDSRDYLHFFYTKWNWGRDSSRPGGDVNAYQHEEENIYYRYRSPEGSWSAPANLTNYSGAWSIQGADFLKQGDRMYGVWLAVLNHETPLSTFRAQVGFRQGALNDWPSGNLIQQWEYSFLAGQHVPSGWPALGVSNLGGEVTVAYAADTQSGILYDYRIDIFGAASDTAGVWSSPENLTGAAGNEIWSPLFVIYRPGSNTGRVFSIMNINVTDEHHPTRGDFYMIDHSGSGWDPPSNITRAEDGQWGNVVRINIDEHGDFHFLYAVTQLAWDPVLFDWIIQGESLRYTRDIDGGFSAAETVMGYKAQTYTGSAGLLFDCYGRAQAVFSTFGYDGVNVFDSSIYHSSEEAAAGGAFGTPEKIRFETDSRIDGLALTSFPDGDLLVSWAEYRFNPAGEPEVGVIYSRYREGGTWEGTVTVSQVPGSADMVHFNPAGWPLYYELESAEHGEQRCAFETARYNSFIGLFYDFRKYYNETINGEWGEPQLVSDIEAAGMYPYLMDDGNRRVQVFYSVSDPATGKRAAYMSMQREPTPPATTYYFAEGTTRAGFEEWISIQNPNENASNVTLTYMLETGENIVNDISVPPHSRSTVDVNLAVGPDHDVSTRVAADSLIMAERPMYFDYYGNTGGHVAVGSQTTGRVWYFAEGTTRGGFSEYLTIQNPTGAAASVDITYVLGDGSTVEGHVDVGARSRSTVDVNAAVGPEQDVSLVVESDVSIVAERPMYFNYQGMWSGGHDVVGSRSLGRLWYFAEGTTRGGFDTYLCVQNPYRVTANVVFTFVLGDGSTVTSSLEVPPTSRRTVKVNDIVGPDQDVSTVVESDSMVLVERPMYFGYHGVWPGGHVAMGTDSAKNSWYFAEGTTREGFEEWLSLENPGDLGTEATISYMLEDGTLQTEVVSVPEHTRVTVDVPAHVGTGRDVSVSIWADRGIIAERPMYFMYHGMWPGGHDVVGL